MVWSNSGDILKWKSSTSRSDIELLFDRLPEPIDLDLDLENRVLYWTDRGDPPLLYTVSLDGATHKVLLAAQGNLTGVAYAD